MLRGFQRPHVAMHFDGNIFQAGCWTPFHVEFLEYPPQVDQKVPNLRTHLGVSQDRIPKRLLEKLPFGYGSNLNHQEFDRVLSTFPSTQGNPC